MIYLGCFAVSTFFLWLNVKGKKYKSVFILIALLIPCILAGMRSLSVGTDAGDYPLSMYNIAINSRYIEYLNTTFTHMWVEDYVYEMGIGYATFIYIISVIFESYAAVLFFTEAVIVFCVFRAIYISFSKQYRWLAMLLFYLMFYNVTLNNMRQWMAMAILLLGFAYLIKSRKRWIIYAAIGVTFHRTAICGLLVYLIYALIKKIEWPTVRFDLKKCNGKFIVVIAIVLLAAVFVFNMGLTRKVISLVGLSSFLNYFAGSVSFSLGRFVMEIPLIVLIVVNWKDMKNETIRYFFVAFALLNLMMSQMNTMNVLAWRIGAYVSEFSILVYPYVISLCRKKNKQKIEILTVCVYAAVYWFYYFYIHNLHETLPYVIA